MSDIKRKLNITGRCYLKKNKADGAILSFLTDVPIQANLADLLFIFTVPGDGQKYASSYCRLQDRKIDQEVNIDDLDDLEEIRSIGHLKETKRGNIIVCAPRENKRVELDKLVVIATVPGEDKNAAPVYIRRKVYDKSKDEIKTITIGEILEVDEEEDNFGNVIEKQNLIDAGLII